MLFDKSYEKKSQVKRDLMISLTFFGGSLLLIIILL